MGVSVEGLFPLALGRVQYRLDPLDLALGMQAVLELRGAAEGNPTEGCAWTGDINGVWQVHRLPVFAGITQAVQREAWAYLRELGFDPARVALHIQRAWPVVSEPGQVVGRHHHPNAHLSVIVYLNGDGSGRSGCLRLFPHRQVNELVPGLAVGHGGPLEGGSGPGAHWNAPRVDVAPEAGLMVLFPASTDHAVTANDDPDDLRLSLAFDLALSAPLMEGEVAPAEYLAPHPSQWTPLQAP
ncbi:MAG: putative 2OG-Fe(II) oxygenase [Vulcanococcus sp.]